MADEEETVETARLVVDVACSEHFVALSFRSEDQGSDVPVQVSTFHVCRDAGGKTLAQCVSSGVTAAIARGRTDGEVCAARVVGEVARMLRVGANAEVERLNGLGRAGDAGGGGGAPSGQAPAGGRERAELVVADGTGSRAGP